MVFSIYSVHLKPQLLHRRNYTTSGHPCISKHSFSVNYLPCFIILIPIFTLWESHTAVREILKHPFNKSSGSKMFCAICKKKRWRTLFKIITLCDLWAFFGAFRLAEESFASMCAKIFPFRVSWLTFISIYTRCHWNVPCVANELHPKTAAPDIEFNGENSSQEREKFENPPDSLCTALECINFSPTRPTRNKHFRLLIFRTEIKRIERISRCFFFVRRLRQSLDKFTRNLFKWVL